MSVTTFAKSKLRTTVKSISGVIYAIPSEPSTLVNTLAPNALLPVTTATILNNGAIFPLLIKPLYERNLDPAKSNYYTKLTGTFKTAHLPFSFLNLLSPFVKLMTSN